MARIPNREIEKLKTEVSLLRLMERQGYQPQKQGKDYAQNHRVRSCSVPSAIGWVEV